MQPDNVKSKNRSSTAPERCRLLNGRYERLVSLVARLYELAAADLWGVPVIRGQIH